ncbi:MAG: caspase family protein, partial [bacterium]|nr:caspase family protein [bacterium]
KLFNQVLDKEAFLTVIVDACHSGSISRGLPVQRRYRLAPPEACDVSDPPDKRKTPAERGALILSASMDFQEASEYYDEEIDKSHGLFTWALVKILTSYVTIEPIGTVMMRVNAMMQSEGRRQRLKLHHPTTEALAVLRNKPLFGEKLGKGYGIVAAVSGVDGNNVDLQGGYAAGIRKNCELKIIAGNKDEPEIRVRVTRVSGLNRCRAKVIAGEAVKIKVGDLFEIHKWVAAREARMRVWIPAGPFAAEDLNSFAHLIGKLKEAEAVVWISNPTKQSPTHILDWYKSGWRLQSNKGKTLKLGKNPGSEKILKNILACQWQGKGKPRLFCQLPLDSRSNKALRAEITDYEGAIKIVPSKKSAHYFLVGRFHNGVIQYAWMLPNIRQKKRDGFALPIISAWIPLLKGDDGPGQVVSRLGDKLLGLVRIRAWLQLPSPPDKGKFPYRLYLKNAETGELRNTGPLEEKNLFGLVLRADKAVLDDVEEKEERFVYVFHINKNGGGTLLFPERTKMNSENHFPADGEWQTEITLGDKELFEIIRPFGMDTYFLLTTKEAISNPAVLDFEGVRGETKGQLASPLERLLYGIGSPTSRAAGATFTDWSVQRLPILSIEGKK